MKKFTNVLHTVSYNFRKTRKYLRHAVINNVFVSYVQSVVMNLLQLFLIFKQTVFSLWKFQSLDEVKTLVYMEVYILSRLLSLEEYFILNIAED